MEIPEYYPIEQPSEVPNGTINGNQDLLTMFGLHTTYDTYVKPYIKPATSTAATASSQENGEAKKNKMESTFKLFVQDLPGRNTISKKDSSLPKIRDLLFDPEFQPPTITADSIDNSTLAEAFGRLPPGSIPNVSSDTGGVAQLTGLSSIRRCSQVGTTTMRDAKRRKRRGGVRMKRRASTALRMERRRLVLTIER